MVVIIGLVLRRFSQAIDQERFDMILPKEISRNLIQKSFPLVFPYNRSDASWGLDSTLIDEKLLVVTQSAIGLPKLFGWDTKFRDPNPLSSESKTLLHVLLNYKRSQRSDKIKPLKIVSGKLSGVDLHPVTRKPWADKMHVMDIMLWPMVRMDRDCICIGKRLAIRSKHPHEPICVDMRNSRRNHDHLCATPMNLISSGK